MVFFKNKISLIKECSGEWERDNLMWDKLKSGILEIIKESK